MLNGRLPDSALAAIAGGRLRKDGASPSWNAMNAHSRLKYGVTLLPVGPMSSYRSYPQQVYLWTLYRAGRGNLAAVPGTSNHGLGVAVDVRTPQMRSIVDRIGAAYGWAKRWSDASSEWWHLKYRPGVWKGHAAPRSLRHGAVGASVKTLQNLLRKKNVKGAPRPTGYFNAATVKAVKRFQAKHHLKPDGIVGAKTWTELRRKA